MSSGGNNADSTAPPSSQQTSQPSHRRSSSTRPPGAGLRPIATRTAIVPRDAEAEKALRRRVTQGLPKARRHFDPNRIEITLPPEFSSAVAAPPMGPPPAQLLLGVPGKASGHPEGFDLVSTNNQFYFPSPTTVLGAGRVDPFNNYPIKMNDGLLHIIDQCELQVHFYWWILLTLSV